MPTDIVFKAYGAFNSVEELAAQLLIDGTALPAVAEAGSVNVGAPRATNRTVAGLTVRRRTIRGYLPNTGKWVNKINGAAGYLIFSATTPAHYLNFGGVAEKSGQFYDLTLYVKAMGQRIIQEETKINATGTITVITRHSLDGGDTWSAWV